MPRTTDAPGAEQIRWRCGCQDADHCQSPAKACQKVQRLEDELVALRAELAEARPVVAAATAVVAEWGTRAEDWYRPVFEDLIVDLRRALAARDGADEAAAPPR